jgi:hypothetical protein
MATATCDVYRVAGFYFQKARGSWLLEEEGVAASGASSGVLRDSSSRPGKATCSSPGWLLLPRERHGHGKGTTSSQLTVKSKRGHGVCHLLPKRTPDRPARPVRR